jgi:hypothetical protein
VIIAIVGSALIIGSCVGTAWLLARLGVVPVQGITPVSTHEGCSVDATRETSPARPIMLDLSRLSQNYSVFATSLILSNAVVASAAARGEIRTRHMAIQEGCSLWTADSVTSTSTPIVTTFQHAA